MFGGVAFCRGWRWVFLYACDYISYHSWLTEYALLKICLYSPDRKIFSRQSLGINTQRGDLCPVLHIYRSDQRYSCGLNLLMNMQWWCFVSLGILHCSLTRLPALAVWRCSLANHGVQRWAFYQWECTFHGVGVCRLCWASLYGWVFLAGCLKWPAPPTKEVKFMCIPAALIPSSVFVCDAQLCSINPSPPKNNHDPLCLHDALWTRTAAAHDDAPRFRRWCFTFYR